MQIADHRLLGPRFERRLKAALDSVVPRTTNFSDARYRSERWARSNRPWRFAPAFVGLAAIGITALSAAAATGSPSPAVWTQRAVSTIQSVSHIPVTSPSLPQSSAPDPRGTAPVSQQTVTSHATPAAGRQAEPTDQPKASDKPAGTSPPPDGFGAPPSDHSQQPSPSPPAQDSPPHDSPPNDSPGHDSSSSPPKDDHGGGGHGH
jgi:hypothetical protein